MSLPLHLQLSHVKHKEKNIKEQSFATSDSATLEVQENTDPRRLIDDGKNSTPS